MGGLCAVVNWVEDVVVVAEALSEDGKGLVKISP